MAPSGPHSSLVANVATVVGAFFMTAILLGLVEGGLRLVGLGDTDASRASRLKYQQVHLPILVPGQRPDGTPIFRTVDQRLPYQSILHEKPSGALRVFAFGGSATAGLGFSPNVTFARQLETMLERAYRDRATEVVNLGIVALSSSQVKVLVEDVLRCCEPDVVVVYSGNNEFLEIHAEKYADAHASWISPLQDGLMRTNLYRVVHRALRGPPRPPSLAEQDFSREDLRLTQASIIEHVEVSRDEIAAVVDRYDANLREAVRLGREAGVPVLLMTVASNWKWRGRSDLPEDWMDELLGDTGPATPERLERARARIGTELASASDRERSGWLFKRAVVAERLGSFEAARADYRAAMNSDPHLRRALDAMADRVRALAEGPGVRVVDTIEVLSRHAKHGIIGFEEFYDYVHFTPTGAVRTAAAVFEGLAALGVVPTTDFDLDAHARREIEHLASLREDPLDVREWLGIGFDRAAISDRDLWKYDRMLADLDARIESAPDDFRALVYRGNAASFRPDGAADAASDYRTALGLEAGHPTVRGNLRRLLAERSP